MDPDWNDALARIAACSCLTRDWDGYGGEPPRAAAVEEALAFARLCEAAGALPPRSGPGGDGEVCLWWRLPSPVVREDRALVEIRFRGAGRLSFHAESEGVGDSSEEDARADALPFSLIPHLEAHCRLCLAADGASMPAKEGRADDAIAAQP